MLTLYYLMKKSRAKTKLRADEYYRSINTPKWLKIKDKTSRCRVCLQEGTVPIYGNSETSSILEALQSVSGIEVNEYDEYPKYLCDVCHDFIKGAIEFKKVAWQSDEILKQPVKEEAAVYNQSLDQDLSDGSTYDTKPLSDGSTYDSKPIIDGGTYDMKPPSEEWIPKEDCEIKTETKKLKKVKIKYASKVTCNICDKVVNRSYFKEHMTMHDPDHKKYVCDVCGKSFRLRCAYHNHSLRHRTDFPYKCQFCPYKGRYSELLKTHMRTHTGDYRYMCTECPARFLFKSNLNSHMLKHKEPQFKCEACKRAFHTKLMLQRHFEADHLGIKNHVCNVCGKAFGYRNAMMKHQRHVHKREKLLFGRMPAYLEAEHRNDDVL